MCYFVGVGYYFGGVCYGCCGCDCCVGFVVVCVGCCFVVGGYVGCGGELVDFCCVDRGCGGCIGFVIGFDFWGFLYYFGDGM